MTRLCLLACLTLALACATPVRTEILPAGKAWSVRRIAVAPPRLDLFDPSEVPLESETVRQAGEVVGARLVQALDASGRYETISPAEVGTALQAAGISTGPQTPGAVGRALEEAFGADTILFARVRRFLPRRGGDRGARWGASVWFDVNLRAPDGTLLWRGSYDETQEGLADDLLSFRRASARRFRWVTAEELVAFGAAELVARMPEPD
jgi:hypothetical protein